CVQKAVRKVSMKKQIFPCTKPKINEANGKHDVFSLNANLPTLKFGHESQTMTIGNKTSVNGTITKPFCNNYCAGGYRNKNSGNKNKNSATENEGDGNGVHNADRGIPQEDFLSRNDHAVTTPAKKLRVPSCLVVKTNCRERLKNKKANDCFRSFAWGLLELRSCHIE
ncbi:MAG: hypothetical protein FWH27_05215, partial [Planctomycetaceae bacterium]|nr:hypothetical protein [Planctomycetaceae bacterium]